MKAIIVGIQGKQAVALRKDGSFIKIKRNPHMQIGYEIDLERMPGFNTRTMVRITSVAAAFMLMLGLSYGVYSYSSPYSVVNMDINPSVEITVNVFDRIIKTEALNADGEKLIPSGGFKNRKLDEGIAELLEAAVDEGYLKTEEGSAVVFTISSKDEHKSQELHAALEITAEKELSEEKVESTVMVEETTLQKHDDARTLGLSPGKLSLIQKLVEEKPDLKVDDLKDTPVKEIMKSLKGIEKEKKQQQKEEDKAAKEADKDNGNKKDPASGEKPDPDKKNEEPSTAAKSNGDAVSGSKDSGSKDGKTKDRAGNGAGKDKGAKGSSGKKDNGKGNSGSKDAGKEEDSSESGPEDTPGSPDSTHDNGSRDGEKDKDKGKNNDKDSGKDKGKDKK